MHQWLFTLAAFIAFFMIIVMGICMVDVVLRLRKLAVTEKKILIVMVEMLNEIRGSKGKLK